MIKYAKLGDICQVRRGTTITRKDITNGNIPVIAGGRKATYFHNKHNREAGVITISGSGASAGLVNFWSTPIFASDCSTVELKDGTQDLLFIYHYLKSLQKFIYKNMRSGAAQPHVYAKDISKLKIPILSLNLQQKIVDKIELVSSEINGLIHNENDKMYEVKSMRNAILKSTFKNRWELIRLGDILTTSAGGTPLKSKKEYYENGDISWLKSGAVCEKEILYSKTFITKIGLDKSSAKLFPKNSVLVAMYGATAAQVGILRFESATNQAVCGIFPNEKYHPEFLYYYISFIKDDLLKKTSGTAQPNLSQIKIKDILIPKIDLIKQKNILSKIDYTFNKLLIIEKNIIKKIKNLKDLKLMNINHSIQKKVA